MLPEQITRFILPFLDILTPASFESAKLEIIFMIKFPNGNKCGDRQSRTSFNMKEASDLDSEPRRRETKQSSSGKRVCVTYTPLNPYFIW